MKLKIPNKNYGVTELYDVVAELMGYDANEIIYDCCKINIAKNIQDGIYEKYLELGMENKIPKADILAGVTMLLACSGPKVDANLADNEVEVLDGFVL